MNPTLKDTAIILKEIFKTHSSITEAFLNRDDSPLNNREHYNNIKILVSKKILFFINKSYVPNSDELDFFIENEITLSEKEEQDRVEREKKTVKLAQEANTIAKDSNKIAEKARREAKFSIFIAFLSFLVAVIALFKK